ncbi:MAG: hypothetical protein K0S65_1108 [Labilithrix sp.]|nr:hypothetical protein [Labilithrix sp.]
MLKSLPTVKVATWPLLIATCMACSDDPAANAPGSETGTGTGSGPDGGGGGTVEGRLPPPGPPVVKTLTIELVPGAGSEAPRRINFAVPAPPGQVANANLVQVKANGTALATARRVLASWPDGSARSVQIQFDLAVPASVNVDVTVNEQASGGDLPFVPVEETLANADGTNGPAVWAVFPATWLSESRVAGPSLPSAAVANTPAAGWDRVCDYEKFDTDAFLAIQSETGSPLFDRPTALYRGYQRTGKISPLRSAYREAALYRARLTGTGSGTRIGVGAAGDLKYHYTQGLAVHYLLTGDDRFREAAENVAIRAHDLWTVPGYKGGTDEFWTERHAGFGLLAYEWAAAVTDDKAAQLGGWAKEAVDAYLDAQGRWPSGYTNADERCFAHEAQAHGEDYGYYGCSPWMSAILADALDTHADRVARAGDQARAQKVWTSLVQLGRFVAAQGIEPGTGRPYYWAGVGNDSNEVDDFDEHWGESAYVVALAWHWSGRTNAALKAAADKLVTGLDQKGEAGQLRSFNWQCRSSVIAPFYLQ